MASSNKAPSWYARLAAFRVEDLFSRKHQPGPPRTVFVNQKLPAAYFDHKGRLKREHVFASNQVITSKYSLITFIPRNLLEQFRRVANIYFLAISILQFFPKFSTITPGIVILPLLIILGITAAKDGYEDYKRHQADKKVNYSRTKVLVGSDIPNANGTNVKIKTFIRRILPERRMSVGSGISDLKLDGSKSSNDNISPLPRDPIEYDYDDGDEKKAHWKEMFWEDLRVGDFVKIMDNEPFPADILICATSEDENVAFVETKGLDGETNLKSRHAVEDLVHLRNAKACANARSAFEINCDGPDNNMYRLNAVAHVDGKTSPVDLNMVFLRGTVLRNTSWAIGVVLFTGEDTKVVMNSGGTPSKRSKVERQMNPQVMINLAILFTMAVVCGIADSALEKHYYPLGAPWLYGDDQSDDNPKINGLITWAFALLTFQDIVPISLYISIEVVRTLQAAFIYFDYDIYYEKTKQATIARSWNLSDDLGQIEYIFSDKTGTLTQNQMIFRECSIGGVVYDGDSAPPEYDNISKQEIFSLADIKEDVKDEKAIHIELIPLSTNTGSPHLSTSAGGDPSRQRDSDSSEPRDITRFKDFQLQQDLDEAISADPGSEGATHARNLNGFFTVLSLCHTVLAAVDPTTGTTTYKAQSPDEAALVQAAADVGFKFLGRDRETLSLETPFSSEVEKYELLNILEFTSARKRMSVVVRKLNQEDDRLFLLTKGADNVIFDRLRPGVDELRAETERHLNEFANSGLRTLTLAYRIITQDDYAAWSERYHEATVSMDQREERVEDVCNELEQDLRLLGATAIEDRLQDGVPETIADLKRAGIKIWVATGDKMETAIAIGRSTNLVSPESNIIIVRGGGRPVHQQMIRSFEQFFPEADINAEPLPRSSTSSRDPALGVPLERINTGISSMVGPDNGDRPGGFVLVVDGAALLEAFADDENKALLLNLARQCDGVICCRVSPLQKALIVKLVKEGIGAMTLAIGDGANDVSMIQAADVGIGISGEEGLQAVNSSDYAIAQFRFLKKLLLVHGHWSYARNGTMILNFFYKNLVPTGVLWWFQIYCGWSAHFGFDYIYVLFWNSLWTIAPVVGIGLFDRILDYSILMELPELYHYGREGYWFGLRSFFVYLFHGAIQSVIIFFLILYTYVSPTSRKDGYDINQTEFSTTMAIVTVMIANMFAGLNASAWTAWLFFAVFIGIVVVWVFTAIYSIISPGYAVTAFYGNDHFAFRSAYFWLCLPIVFLLAMLPRYLDKAWQFGFAPTDIDILRAAKKKDPYADWTQYSSTNKASGLAAFKPRHSLGSRRTSRTNSVVSLHAATRPSMDVRAASRTDMSTGLVSLDRGFDFATEEHGVQIQRIQTNLSERRLSSKNVVHQHDSNGKGKGTFRRVFTLRRNRGKPEAFDL